MFSKLYSQKFTSESPRILFTRTRFILCACISLAAALLFVAHPLFAQTIPPPVSANSQNVNESNGENSDFDNDVKQGKDELSKDPVAQRLQKEVVDGEDGEAGEGDGQNNQEGVDEYGDVQNAENNQGVNEENKDINNSGVDEVSDANNLGAESQEIINEHQAQEEEEIENGQQNQKGTSENDTSNQGSNLEQNQGEEPDNNQ